MIPNRFKNIFTFRLHTRAFLTLFLLALSSLMPVANAKHILVFGDSLSAAYGMELEQGWAHLLSESLGDDYTLTNASISGETSGGGLARIELTLEEFKPDLVLLELGANDGLQGLSIDTMRNNLDNMIQLSKAAGSSVVLAGISLPASYGPRYIDKFRATFSELATLHDIPLVDFYRDEFITTPGYIQADGLHPTPVTQPLIRDIILEFLKTNKLLD